MLVKKGDWVEVEYTGKLKNGNIFDTSKNKGNLKFKIDSNMVIKGFDAAILGMQVGSEKTFTIPFDQAYGPRNTQVVSIPLSVFNQVPELKKGNCYDFMTEMGPIKIDVEDVLEDSVRAVVNHPFAGEDLTFEVKLINILDSKESEVLEKEFEQHSHSCEDCEHDSHEDCEDCGEHH